MRFQDNNGFNGILIYLIFILTLCSIIQKDFNLVFSPEEWNAGGSLILTNSDFKPVSS